MATTIAGFSNPNTISEPTWAAFWSQTPMREQVVGFAVTPVASTMNLSVAGGSAWLSGIYYFTDVADSVTVTANSSGSTRYDLVVLEADWSGKTVTAEIVAGTPGSGVAPSATRTAGTLWQAEVAVIEVGDGVSEITSGNITMVPLPVVPLYSMPTISGLTDERLPPVAWKAAVHAQDTGLLYVSDGTAYQEVVPSTHTHSQYQNQILSGTGTAPSSGVEDGDVYLRYT